MPYICVYDDRYIGEHDCNIYPKGDQTMIRDCCVQDAIKWRDNTIKKAITEEHPSYTIFLTAYSCLTDAEMEIVGNLIYDYNRGFFARLSDGTEIDWYTFYSKKED